jgi:hypothetical protein
MVRSRSPVLHLCARVKRGAEVVRGKTGGTVEVESFYSTLRARPSLRPPGEPKDVGGKQCAHRSAVLPWLAMTDEYIERVKLPVEARG